MFLYVQPDHFSWLVVAVLDVAYETDLDFDFSAPATLVPADGKLEIDGPGADRARVEIRNRLEAQNVKLSEVSLV